MKRVYIVGEIFDLKVGSWGFAGVYEDLESARNRCTNKKFFVGAVGLNEPVPEETLDWPAKDFEYPKIRQSIVA